MAGGCAVVMGSLTLWALRRVSPPTPSTAAGCTGMPPAPRPATHARPGRPLDYARRLAREDARNRRPRPIAADYARLRYGPAPADAALLKRFHHSSRKFRPR